MFKIRDWKLCTLIIVVSLFVLSVAVPLKNGVKAALTTYEPKTPGAVSQPPKGGNYIDPVFGTKIIRLTDAADGGTSNIAYSYWPAFNSNSTKLIIAHDWNPYLYSFDPVTHAFNKLYPVFNCSCQEMRWEGMTWSTTDPDIIYGISGYLSNVQLRAYNVVTKQYVFTKDFAAVGITGGIVYQMSKARSNDRYFSFHWRPSETSAIKYAVVYDKVLDQTYLFDVTNPTYGVPGFDECRLDRDGNYLVMGTGQEIYVWKFATQTPSQRIKVAYNNIERAGGHTDLGGGILVQTDTWGSNGNRLIRRPLTTPGSWNQLFDSGISDWTTDHHISMCGPNDNWALISTRSYSANYSKPFTNEIFLIKMDGSGQVQRLAHHRSSLSEYWRTPRANLSPDGKFFAFNSDWGGGHNDVYVGVLPTGLWDTGVPNPGPPTVTASATPISGTAPLNVSLTGSASSPNGLITSYNWTFGDGTTGTGPSVTHTYNNAGTFTATLTVTDNANQTASKSLTITVTPPIVIGVPTARLTASVTTGFAPLSVILDGSTSSSPNGAITEYKWDFGDGTIFSGKTMTHIYKAAGSYNTVLTVKDVAGQTGSASLLIKVTSNVSTTISFVNGDGKLASTTYDVGVITTYPTYTIDTTLDGRVGSRSGNITLIAMPNLIGNSSGQIPTGATIVSATLQLKIYGSQATQLAAARILDPDRLGMWFTGSTISNYNAGVSYGYRDARNGMMKKWSNTATSLIAVLATADSSVTLTGSEPAGTLINLNVTPSVTAWANRAINQGWAIRALTTTATPIYIYDSQYGNGFAPKLTVTYTLAK
ncbi:MAG: PKD domain-containing protein [Acidobacteriota bacterium]